MIRQDIAVVGGGAKAAALAAKAYCLRQTGVADINVTVFEKAAIGAHWDGQHGYTDGLQPLCTPADRDLGFPYDPASFGRRTAEMMQANFSWAAWAVRDKDGVFWPNWVDRGERFATHRDFAAYLRDAMSRADVDPILEEVVDFRFQADRWAIRSQPVGAGFGQITDGFDGLVITSPGPHRVDFAIPDPRFFDGESFWRRPADVRAYVGDPSELPVVILGSGGTAAAIAAWLVSNGFRDRPIQLVTRRATLYARTYNYFENRLFNDDHAWAGLHPEERRAFSDRLTRSVVWASVAHLLAKAKDLSIWSGRAVGVRVDPPSQGGEIYVRVQPSWPDKAPEDSRPALFVIDARGFDDWWFAEKLDARTAAFIRANDEVLRQTMKEDLSLDIPGLERLHAPLLSAHIGPGLGSLMVLGAMADRILRPYVLRSTGLTAMPAAAASP